MVYARTIKRRSGNGINASLRNVSDLMMASELSPSQAAAGEEISPGSEPPVAADTPQPAQTATSSGDAPRESLGEPSSLRVDCETAPQLVSSDTHPSAKSEPQSGFHPVHDSSSDSHSGVSYVETATDAEGAGDSLNNNSNSEDISHYDDEIGLEASGMAGSGDPNHLNNNQINSNTGVFILGNSASSSTASSNPQHNHNVRINSNHLNNILNNNIQPAVTNSTNVGQNNNNNNWWAPPPVPGSDPRGSSGKLSLLSNGSNVSANGMQLKYNQGNNVQVATTENGHGAAMLPKAILKCRPNSHPFQTRTLTLIPNMEMKVGRAVARHPVSDVNAIFDCKVLSRNHAVLWYSDDKFYIRDTGSSNGTFVNNQRLSQTCLQSDKFEICSGDIVQFGVDVIENARKETHGCIVATIRLYLPDGRETKASQLTGVSAETGQVLAEDLYRMHQYIKEALLREQMLEVKMNEVQRLLESAKSSVNANWQAMVDEDRLLNRIDILEGKVHVFQKNFGEEKLRDEMRQMQDDKLDYQHAAKEALRRVHQDRYEAVQKLSGVELALRMTEDEASVLRDKFIKSESTLNETMTRLSTVQQKHDELQNKCSELEAKLKTMEAEMALKLEVASEKSLEQLIEAERAAQANIRQEEEQVQKEQKRAEDESTKESFGKADGLIKLFANSDLRNLEGSAEIINSICNATEEDEEGQEEDEDGVSIIERVSNKEDTDTEKQLDTIEATEAVQGISNSKLLYKLQAVEKYLRDVETGGSMKEVLDFRMQDIEEENRSVASSTTSTLRGSGKRSSDDELEEAEKKIRELLEKVSQLERENETLSGELEDRPTMSQLEAKVKLADDLQMELMAGQMKVAELREKLEDSVRRYERLSRELRELREAQDRTDQNVVDVEEAAREAAEKERVEQEMDEKMLTNPMVEVEEELVLYKEKFVSLSEENIRLQKEMEVTRKNYEEVMHRSMMKLLMYVGPVVAVLGYFVLWPYL